MRRKPYDPRIARFLEEIGSTPTGWPLIEWVQLHWPRIVYGQPVTGGAFAYPWPLSRIVLKDTGSDAWQRETLAHELTHTVRWRGHLVGSLEQEYDAYRNAAKTNCEWNGWDWHDPAEEVLKRYPLLFGPDANPAEFKQQLRNRLPFYAILPWEQPRDPASISLAMLQQGWFGIRQMLNGKQKTLLATIAKKS